MFPWFALRVRSNFERTASIHLKSRGFEDFAPSYEVTRNWSDRVKKVERFLFPGYVFCRLDPSDRLPVLSVPGVVNIVGFGNGPIAIPDTEMSAVQTMVDSGLVLSPWPYLQVGQSVLIERGPLAGIEGILESVKGRDRLVVSITLLQRAVATEIDRAWIRPVAPPKTHRHAATQSAQPSVRLIPEPAAKSA